VAVEGLASGPAVIRAFVPDSVLRHGVARAWLLLGGVGLLLLLLSVVWRTSSPAPWFAR